MVIIASEYKETMCYVVILNFSAYQQELTFYFGEIYLDSVT